MNERERRALALWTAATPSVSAFVHALLADRSERDDVLQEVALAVFDSFDEFDPTRPFLPWALAIARRKVADALRRQGRAPSLSSDSAVDALSHALAEVESEQDERLRWLGECLEQLEGRAKQACELRYVDGLKPAQIAVRLGLSANTASKLLQRVRDALRECIEHRQRTEGRA